MDTKKHSKIEESAKELKNLYEKACTKRIFFVAHSRGGLVARYAIQKYGIFPHALICLSVPHKGSFLANLIIKYKKPIKLFFRKLAPYLQAIDQLRTQSPFIHKLNSWYSLEKEASVLHFDIAGNSTHYFSCLGINFLESIEKIFGSFLLPEMKNKVGDGFVSIESAKSPLTQPENFYIFPVNHLTILLDREVQDAVLRILLEFAS